MFDYIVKVHKKYKLDPQKVVDNCKGHPFLTDKDPNLCSYPTYEGIQGTYHKFVAPTEATIGVLIQEIQFETEGLVKKILIETQ